MKEKTLPKAFRITEETANKFKEIAQELGENQQQTLARLIEVYEMETGKETLPEMREQIDTFDGHLHALSALFLQILETNHTMRSQVRTEYQAQLDSKDRTIIELQERLKETEEWKKESKKNEEEHEAQLKASADELKILQKELEKIQANTVKMEEEFKKKEEAYEREQKRIQDAETEVRASLTSFIKNNGLLKEENDRLRSQAKELDVQVFKLGRECEARRMELEKNDLMISQHEEEMANALERQKTEHQLALQKREMELKDQFYAREEKLREELDQYKEFYYKNQKIYDQTATI